MCAICMEMVPAESLTATTRQCACRYCKACVETYLIERIAKNQIERIPCLNAACPEAFAEEEVLEKVDAQTATRYRRFQVALRIARDPQLRWCLSVDCESVLRRNGSAG